MPNNRNEGRLSADRMRGSYILLTSVIIQNSLGRLLKLILTDGEYLSSVILYLSTFFCIYQFSYIEIFIPLLPRQY